MLFKKMTQTIFQELIRITNHLKFSSLMGKFSSYPVTSQKVLSKNLENKNKGAISLISLSDRLVLLAKNLKLNIKQ